MRAGKREGDAVLGLGAAERRRVPGGAEAPPARAPTPRPFVQRRTRGPLQVGERSGGGGEESRAARPASGALGLRAPLSARLGFRGARESGFFGCRARLIVRQVRGRPAAGRAAKVGGGRAGGGGRRARAGLVVGVSVFFLKTPLGRARGGGGVCFPTPGARGGHPGGGGGRRRGPASGAFPATCQFYCCRARESLHYSPRRRSARWMPDRPSSPPLETPAPAGPRASGTPRLRGVGGAGEGAGAGSETCGRGGELREPPRSSRAGPRNAWIHGPGAGTGLSCPLPARRWGTSRILEGSPAFFLFFYASLHSRTHFGPRWSLAEPLSSALGPARSGRR